MFNWLRKKASAEAVVPKTDIATTHAVSIAHSAMSEGEAFRNQGNSNLDNGKLDDAAECYRRAIECNPQYAEAYTNLGVVYQAKGNLSEAAELYRKAIALNPGLLIAHQNLSGVLLMLGQADAAEESFRRVISLSPDHPYALLNLGVIAARRGDLPQAEAFLRRACELEPNVDTLYKLGNVLKDQRKLEAAVECYRQAFEIKPDYFRVPNNLGVALHNNLGMALLELGQHDRAVASFHHALEIKPDFALTYFNLGTALGELGQFDDAIASYRKALEIAPDFDTYSNLLLILNFTAHLPPYYLYQARLFGQLAAQKLSERYSSWKCAVNPKRLRVGLVSGDLREHSVGHFLEGLITQIDPARIELFAYPTCNDEDELTARIYPYFSAWKPLFGLDDEAASRLIRDDGVHVLFDLSVHTAKNRLSVFAWKPAPIQVSWLGLPSTTGIAEMDYVLGDPHAIPSDCESHFSETVWRMPDSYLCFTNPVCSVGVAPLPALSAGYVTFGSFNNLTKMTDEVVAVWARVLQSVPDSRLLLKTQQLSNPYFCEKTHKRFALHGIPPDRLILIGRLASSTDHLATYNKIDIALDTFPYPGVTTSVEALWMGVPVLSLRGDRFLSYTAGSIAHNAGLADWVAADEDDYVAKAVKFTSNLECLSALRTNLRQQVATCPLFDAPRFARNFEDTLWDMYGQYLNKANSSPLGNQ